ncbi:MAG: DUF134 domain-containing protein [Dehalococcoidia bacterium]|nr:DUF134 domain-containing protein [Dehalococcoidia bacterium]
MTRPTKWRKVGFVPEITYFKPAGIPLRFLEEVRLTVEEAEAIRLKDLEDLEQEDCARRMGVSRSTFHRVLESARKKLADALLKGKAIRIEGGNFQIATHRFRCASQGHEWDVPSECDQALPESCPTCRSTEVHPVPVCSPVEHGGHRGGRGCRSTQ